MSPQGSQATLNSFTQKIKTTLEETATEPQLAIPRGWKWAPLPDIAKIIMGQSPPSQTYNDVGEGMPFYQGKAEFGPVHPTPRKWCSQPLKIASENDVLISVRAPVGPVNLCKEKSCIGRGLAAIRVKDRVDHKFVFFFLISKESELAELGKGSTFGAIRRRDLESLTVPLPSLEEQRRIVARIEEIRSRIEQAKKLREEALKDTEAIIQSALHQIFFEAEEEGWKWVRLGDVIESLRNGIYKPAGFYGKGYPCLRMYNIQNRRIVLKDIKYLEVTPKELEKYGLLPNDILINRVNSLELVGKAALITEGIGPCTFESKNIRMRVKKNLILPSFLVYLLDSQTVREQISKLAKPIIGQATINQKDIVSLKVPIPSLAEQKNITDSLVNLQSKVGILQKQQEETRKAIEAITQAVLRKAFSGRL